MDCSLAFTPPLIHLSPRNSVSSTFLASDCTGAKAAIDNLLTPQDAHG